MIDTFKEEMLNLEQATHHFSKICRRQRNRHVILRWMNRGCHGVVLESIRLGREVFTSAEAINRFTNRLAGAAREKNEDIPKEVIAAESVIAADLDAQAKRLGI